MKRTDKHCPSKLVPADYQHHLSFAWGGSGSFPDNLPHNVDILANMRATRPFFHKKSGKGGCDVCGAAFRFGDVFEHMPTGEHVVVGWECGEAIGALGDHFEFKREYANVKQTALAELKRAEKGLALAGFLAANPGLADALQGDHRILRDLAEKVERFGSLTGPQVALALKIAAELANPAPTGEVPVTEERVQVRGKIVSTKVVDSQFGSTLKMLVEVATPTGPYRVFGKVPAGLRAERGDVVRFSAKVERSERDPSFGFFSRPTKAEVVATTREIDEDAREQAARAASTESQNDE